MGYASTGHGALQTCEENSPCVAGNTRVEGVQLRPEGPQGAEELWGVGPALGTAGWMTELQQSPGWWGWICGIQLGTAGMYGELELSGAAVPVPGLDCKHFCLKMMATQ